jgi:hypothetical protein
MSFLARLIDVFRSTPAGPQRTIGTASGRESFQAVHAAEGTVQRIAILALLALTGTTFAQQQQPKLDFNRDVRPILADTCFKCHGFDPAARKAKLRLDIREEAIQPRKGLTPIVPGRPDKSEVYLRISSTDQRN